MPLRENFPAKGEEYLGGESDGLRYSLTFGGGTLEASYEMLRQFLQEEGYADVPLPADVDELLRFRDPHSRIGQIMLFEDNGYVHNPIKVLFPLDRRKKRLLHLIIYNEAAPGHLLRFHGRLS